MSTAMKEGALITYALDEIIETLSVITTFTDMAQDYRPPGAELQRSAMGDARTTRKPMKWSRESGR